MKPRSTTNAESFRQAAENLKKFTVHLNITKVKISTRLYVNAKGKIKAYQNFRLN